MAFYMEQTNLEISITQAAQYISKYYGLSGQLKKLPGEVDFNFYVKCEDGKKYTQKISRSNTRHEDIDFQSAIMHHLSMSKMPLDIPHVVLSTTGKVYIELDDQRFLRLQKWVPGRMFSEVNPRSPKVLESWGKTCGLLSQHLSDFDHPAAHRFYKWNPSEVLVAKKHSPYIQGATA